MAALALFRNRGRAFRDASLAAIAGVAFAFGLPGVDLAPLFLLSLVALAFLAVRATSWASTLGIGVAFGASAFLVTTVGSAGWGTIVPIGLTFIGMALYSLPFVTLARWISAQLDQRYAFLCALAGWTLCAELRSQIEFPIHFEAFALVAAAPVLAGGVRLFGTSILCGLLVAAAIACGTRLARSPLASVRDALGTLEPFALSLAVLCGSSALAHLTARAPSTSISVGVPQMNESSDYYHLRQAIPAEREAFDTLLANQLRELQDVDLLALTESYDGAFPLLVPRLRRRFQAYAKLQHQAVLLTSYLVAPDSGGYNAAGAIDSDGNLVGVHRKVNLAPFGEVEFESGSGFRPAPVLPNVKIGVLICQEALLPEGPRKLALAGANLLVTPTSDASFGSSILVFGHLAGARLRAIEAGRSMIWSSAAGPSGAITRWGGFEPAAPFRAPAAARMTAEIYDEVTPFSKIYWSIPPLAALGLLWLGLFRRSPSAQLSRPSPLGTLRGLAELGLALGFAAFTVALSPALVELQHGQPARVKASVNELLGELLGRSENPFPDASLARFVTDKEHSGAGALAYYLDFYGLKSLPTDADIELAQPTLASIERILKDSIGFPARAIELDFKALPRAGTLVVTRAGEVGFLTSNRQGLVALFLPTQGAISILTSEQASHLLVESALVPAADPELERLGR